MDRKKADKKLSLDIRSFFRKNKVAITEEIKQQIADNVRALNDQIFSMLPEGAKAKQIKEVSQMVYEDYDPEFAKFMRNKKMDRKCPKGKIRNRTSGKCEFTIEGFGDYKCPKGKKKDMEKMKCVLTSKEMAKRARERYERKMAKECKPGKERDILGRCVKICEDGKARNILGRCVLTPEEKKARKDARFRLLMATSCPEGKFRNPKGRCVLTPEERKARRAKGMTTFSERAMRALEKHLKKLEGDERDEMKEIINVASKYFRSGDVLEAYFESPLDEKSPNDIINIFVNAVSKIDYAKRYMKSARFARDSIENLYLAEMDDRKGDYPFASKLAGLTAQKARKYPLNRAWQEAEKQAEIFAKEATENFNNPDRPTEEQEEREPPEEEEEPEEPEEF